MRSKIEIPNGTTTLDLKIPSQDRPALLVGFVSPVSPSVRNPVTIRRSNQERAVIRDSDWFLDSSPHPHLSEATSHDTLDLNRLQLPSMAQPFRMQGKI